MDIANNEQFINGVFLPTDYTQAGKNAFYHALKIALCSRTPLRMIHVDPPGELSVWSGFPKVRSTLARWFGKDEVTVEQLELMGLAVRKTIAKNQSTANAISSGLKKHRNQLLVLAPHTHKGLGGMLHKSVSLETARKSGGARLFLPEGVPGFVDEDTGEASLKTVLVPVDREPDPEIAVSAARSFLELLGTQGVRCVLLHVGQDQPLSLPADDAYCKWESMTVDGDPVAGIGRTADELNADLLVMVSEGRHGLVDNLRGSTTERVVKSAQRSVLVAPA